MGYAQPHTAGASGVLRLGLRARLRAARDARMVSVRARARLARYVEDAITRADRPHGPFSAVVPVSPEAVHEARGALLDLAERLRGPRPVAPHGVRLAQELLADGAGPLYAPARRGDLRAAALLALQALDDHGAGG
jgi:hypothetical protein